MLYSEKPGIVSHHDYHSITMAVLTRLAARLYKLSCGIILALFFSIPLALLACLTTSLAIFSALVLAFRMISAAIANRIDFWRGNEHQPGPNEAQIHEAVHHLIGGPSLVQTSRPRSARTMSSGSYMQSTNDRGFDVNYDYDYDYAYALPDDNDNDDDDGSEGLFLGGWRRRNSRTSPSSSRPTTPGTAYRPRSESNGNGNGRGIPNFSSPCLTAVPGSAPSHYPSAALPPAVPVANVAARRSTTSVGSRRSSRVMSAETFVVNREVGEGV